ncbi:collagen alpha-1(I) chain-like [Nannospalax galili]|uniref:collagen alpha-1(I) chain-like n=1 Tax=Nannospalax galili TaxID=1026970 RepID=UPI00111C7F25|nr:collagen alpha-1(I) chain-like [Nannospalax galili]
MHGWYERNAEFGKAPVWPPGIPSWPPALGGGDGVCPGDQPRTAQQRAFNQPGRTWVKPRAGGGSRKRALTARALATPAEYPAPAPGERGRARGASPGREPRYPQLGPHREWRPRALVPGLGAPGSHGLGWSQETRGDVGKALPGRREWARKGPRGFSAPGGPGVSPPPGVRLYPSSSGRPGRWRSGKGGGNAVETERGWGWGRKASARGTPPARAGPGTRGPLGPSAGSSGFSSREPPPSRSQPGEQRVWAARSGSGDGGGGRQEDGGGPEGAGGCRPTFLLLAAWWKAPSCERPAEAASESGSARVPYLTAALTPFLPQHPHPLPGSWAWEPLSRRSQERAETRGSSAPCRCRAPPQPLAAPVLKVERAHSPPRELPGTSRSPSSTRSQGLPRRPGLTIRNHGDCRSLLLVSGPSAQHPQDLFRMPRYRSGHTLIIPCRLRGCLKSRVRAVLFLNRGVHA